MNTYFFVMKQVHHRTEEPMANVVGVVTAMDEKGAENKALELAGNDCRALLSVEEIDIETGYSFTVYKSQI